MNELEICRLLKEEIKTESEKNIINTDRIRMLTSELDKFESLLVTSVDQVTKHNQLISGPFENQHLGNNLPRRNESNATMDALMDVANIVLKKSENEYKQKHLNTLFSWCHFLNDNINLYSTSDDMKDRSIKIRDNLFNIITTKMESEIKDMLNDINNINNINDEDIVLKEDILKDDN